MGQANRPTARECWSRLEQLDVALEVVASNWEWRRLKEARKWWSLQLSAAQKREDCAEFAMALESQKRRQNL
jgi:hypothetical protein